MRRHRSLSFSLVRLLPLAAILSGFLSGCTNIGPTTIPRDRFDYNSAISDSWKEQTLLNVVRLRYADMPMFVEVASVVSGYSLESSVSLGVSQDEVAGTRNTLGAASGTSKYTDRPTITYAPITGSDFTASFLSPIPPEIVLFLVQSGWPADTILNLTLDSINGLRSRKFAASSRRAGDPGFYEVVDIIREIQLAGAVGLQVREDDDDKRTTLLIIHKSAIDGEHKESASRLRQLLGIAPDDVEISIEYGYLPTKQAEVAMITRSVLQVIAQLASQVNVPLHHIDEGRTLPSVDMSGQGQWQLDIRNSETEPEGAFVAVQYGDFWYYIDDRDFPSKRVFTIVMLLMSLMESGDRTGLPLVTIPAG